MAVKIRLKRTGRHDLALYRIVAADARAPRDGKFLEILGTYDPNQKPSKVKIDKEKTLKWLNNGAQPTDTIRNILSKVGILKEFHDLKKSKKTTTKKEA